MEKNDKNNEIEQMKYDERGREQVKAWYALVVFPGREIKIREKLIRLAQNKHLANQIFRVIVPAIKEEKVDSKGKTKIKEHMIYTQYVYVEMILNDDTYHAVKIDGVRHILGAPTPIPEYDMRKIFEMMDEEYPGDVTPNEETPIQVGDTVIIHDEQMQLFYQKTGVVMEINEAKKTIELKVDMDGNEAYVQAEIKQVTKQ